MRVNLNRNDLERISKALMDYKDALHEASKFDSTLAEYAIIESSEVDELARGICLGGEYYEYEVHDKFVERHWGSKIIGE